ncbi:MAG: hypothetical protein DRQ88_05520 [Epsilonproteobacteria bacterium]|nr:MAG: hypothetical protein DRQ89_08535 [Campylobacterota bacterium]RLA66775.1 MAG: hypothetical protein DRQ88_05520 [Campylobacterota bacterium]
MPLNFKQAKTDKEIKEILDYNIDAFTDSPDFTWDLEGLKKEMKNGWKVFAVRYKEDEVIAAILIKKAENQLLTKNTTVKAHHQGLGYNHQIKDFFELRARDLKLDEVHHFCRIDNFRMYSLNESHGYKKLNESSSPDKQVVEWIKYLD